VRRVKLILAVVAMMAVTLIGAAPAMASHDYDGWWDSCGWSWTPWGWFVFCEPDYGWWGGPGGYDDYDDDSTVVDYGDDSNGGDSDTITSF